MHHMHHPKVSQKESQKHKQNQKYCDSHSRVLMPPGPGQEGNNLELYGLQGQVSHRLVCMNPKRSESHFIMEEENGLGKI